MKKMELSEMIFELNRLGYCVKPLSVKSPSSAAREVFKKCGGKKQEHFIVVTLDVSLKPIRTHIITKGILDRTIVAPREVFSVAIKDAANSIILGHNHPSGEIEPSDSDINTTIDLIKAGEVLGIPVFDHIIVGNAENDFVSLREIRGDLW